MLRRIARLLFGAYSPSRPPVVDSEDASSSSVETVQEVRTQQVKAMASARDYECSICMMLMIEPVLLPCKHELCYKCFMLNYTNTSDQCPFCRVRIATWARKAIKTNRVINTAKWDLIKKLFPEKVKCILEGKDVISDEEETEMQIIAEAGSLGKEYIAEMEKIESERLQASQKEEAASLALIEQLCQAEGQLFSLPPVKMVSILKSSDAAVAVMTNDRTYSITDENRLKQIKEEEEASLRLIQQLQEEEEQAYKERLKREEFDQKYARMIASTLYQPLPTEPVINTSDCVLISPSPPCASQTSVFCCDASSPSSSAPSSSASTSIMPTSSSSLEFPGSVSLTSTETTDNIVSRFSTYRKGKNTATATALTKWLKMTQLADEKLIPKDAALGANPESGLTASSLPNVTTALSDPVMTNPPTWTNTSSTGELSTEFLSTISRPNVTGNTSEQDNFSEVNATVVQADLANCELMSVFVDPEFSSTVREGFAEDVFTSQVDEVFGPGVPEVPCEPIEPHSEIRKASESSGIQANEIAATSSAKECCFSQLPDLFPTASASQIEEPKQQGGKHGVTVDAVCTVTGMSANTSTSDTPRASAASARVRKDTPRTARGLKNYRSHSSAVAATAKKSLKRSIVYVNDDQEACCSTSSISQATCPSILPNNSRSSAEKRMCLNWSGVGKSGPKLSEDSEIFVDVPTLTRSDFHSDESYRLYLEEEDRQVALHLQRLFDLESRRKTIPRSPETGGYSLRSRGKLSTNSQDEIN